MVVVDGGKSLVSNGSRLGWSKSGVINELIFFRNVVVSIGDVEISIRLVSI